MRELAVVGGGMAGLAAAHYWQQQDLALHVTVYEATNRVGGLVRSDPPSPGSVALEAGPDSLLVRKPAGVALARQIGLGDDLIVSHPDARGALIYYGQHLHPIPPGIVAGVPLHPDRLERTALLSPAGWDALVRDLADPAAPLPGDVSLGAILRQRLGSEWVDRVAAALLSGIYAGDIDQLSLMATYPELARALDEYGSLVRGLVAERAARAPSPGPVFMTLRQGLESLPRELARQFRGTLALLTPIDEVLPEPHGYRLRGAQVDRVVDGVVVATPAWAAARQLAQLLPDVAPLLADVPYANLAVVGAHFAPGAIAVPPNMTGILVPQGTDVAMTAVTFVGQKWAYPDPPADIPVRVFYGRAGQGDEVLSWSDDEFMDRVSHDLHRVLGSVALPGDAVVHRHPRAMPQYLVGHRERIAAIEAQVARHPGLALAGACYRGVGIPDVVADGERAARQVLAGLARTD